MERLRLVLRGRDKYPWGRSVLLSGGAIDRLFKGSLPSPERLVPMARIENLSLTWLLTGSGAPFLVHVPLTDGEAGEQIKRLADESGMQPLLVHCELGFSVVMHTVALKRTSWSSEEYRYREVCVLGGPILGDETREALMYADSLRGEGQALRVTGNQWLRLAVGQMSNTELFGWSHLEGGDRGLYAHATPLEQLVPRLTPATEHGRQYTLGLRELTPSYRGPVFDPQLLVDRFQRLTLAERSCVLRMLEGLIEHR